jgi:hypothetical protein
MEIECGDLTTKATARFSVIDFRDGNEGEPRTAAECLIAGVFLDNILAIVATPCRLFFLLNNLVKAAQAYEIILGGGV